MEDDVSVINSQVETEISDLEGQTNNYSKKNDINSNSNGSDDDIESTSEESAIDNVEKEIIDNLEKNSAVSDKQLTEKVYELKSLFRKRGMDKAHELCM